MGHNIKNGNLFSSICILYYFFRLQDGQTTHQSHAFLDSTVRYKLPHQKPIHVHQEHFLIDLTYTRLLSVPPVLRDITVMEARVQCLEYVLLVITVLKGRGLLQSLDVPMEHTMMGQDCLLSLSVKIVLLVSVTY